MENQVPTEVREYQRQFWAEQKAKEAARAAAKVENPKKIAKLEAFTKKPMNSRQLESYARSQGFEVRGGNGRHGVHLVGQNGYECPSVRHGGGRTLANGTQRALIRQIQQNAIRQIGA